MTIRDKSWPSIVILVLLIVFIVGVTLASARDAGSGEVVVPTPVLAE